MKTKIWFGVAAAAALIIGIGIGAAAAPKADPKSSRPYKDLYTRLQGIQANLGRAQAELANAQQTIAEDEKTIGNLPALEASAQQRLKQLSAQREALQARAAVVNREYNRIKDNTLAGDGVYLAGTDMLPGTYRTAGQAGCYWEVSTDANGTSIVANGNPDGPAFATVGRGQYLTVARCDDWILQR